MKTILVIILSLFAGFQLMAQESTNRPTTKDSTDMQREPLELRIYSEVEQRATPRGGMEKFRKDFSDKLELNRSKMPPDADRMLLFHVRFTVEKDGSLTDVEALDNEYEIGDEIVKVLKT